MNTSGSNTSGLPRRRPLFLAPLWVGALVAILGTVVVYGVVRLSISLFAETTTVIVVRHAEKVTDPAVSDPVLTEAGQERALRLAQLLGSQPLAAIYVSDTKRTQLTAAPLAARLARAPIVRPGREVEGILADIGERYVGETILIVGHSNTVPQFVSRLSRGRVTPTLAEDEFDAIFVVTVTRFGPASVTTLRY